MRVRLHNPVRCRRCNTRGRVLESRTCAGHLRRRHACPACGKRWTSWQTLIDPARLAPKPPAGSR